MDESQSQPTHIRKPSASHTILTLPFILFILFILSIIAWIALALLCYFDTAKTTSTTASGNPANAAYLNVGVNVPQYNPQLDFLTISTSCGIPPTLKDLIREASNVTTTNAYDVTLTTIPVQYDSEKPFSFQYPAETIPSGSTVHIDVTARGYENVIADTTELINTPIVEDDTDLRFADRTWQAPFDTYTVRLTFHMAVPPGLPLEAADAELNSTPQMPCRFYVRHTNGTYRCDVEFLTDNEVQLTFRRDLQYQVLFIPLFAAALFSAILLQTQSASKRHNYLIEVATPMVFTLITWGFTRALIVPHAAASATAYDLIVFLTFAIVLLIPFVISLFRRTQHEPEATLPHPQTEGEDPAKD